MFLEAAVRGRISKLLNGAHRRTRHVRIFEPSHVTWEPNVNFINSDLFKDELRIDFLAAGENIRSQQRTQKSVDPVWFIYLISAVLCYYSSFR